MNSSTISNSFYLFSSRSNACVGKGKYKFVDLLQEDDEFVMFDPKINQTVAKGKFTYKTRIFENSNLKLPPFKSKDKIMKEDVLNHATISFKMSDWPLKYKQRFQRWFTNRCNRTLPENAVHKDFDTWSVVNFDDCMHHLTNWDNGLRKALLASKFRKTENFVKKVYYKNKKFNQKNGQHGTHPHEDEQIVTDSLNFKFVKEPKMNPKTCVIEYTEVHDNLVEQGDSAPLEATSSVKASANITLVDERPVDITSLHTGTEVYSRDTNNDIAESDWGLNKVLTREYPLTSYEWKVANERKTKLYNNGVPKLIVEQKQSLISRQLQFFSFLRCGVKIRVQLNGTKFHCGRLLVFFKPLTWKDDKEENFYGLTCFPHFFLDASLSNSGEIHIPYTHLLTYFSQEHNTLFNDSINSLGEFSIIVFNPLQAADKASQSLFGQIYVSLIDPYVHLPTYEIDSFSYGDGYMQGLESFLKRTTGQLINSGLGVADKFTGGLVTGAGDAICNLLGICDKPADPMSANPMINRTVAPLCHGTGLDRSIRLGLSPVSQTNTSPAVLGAVDSDFNILTLCQIPSLLAQFEWRVNNSPGDKLFDMLVSPVYMSEEQYTYDPTGRFANYNPTMLAYVSRAFCLWRGTLKVKLQVIATQFHSGRLALVYDPHGCYNFNLKDLERNKSHNIIIMDLQEQQELVVELPYFSVKPWLRCDKFRSNVNLVDGQDVQNPSFIDCDISGVFRIFVLNSLVRPDNVTDKIELNVFFYAGDNFELSVPNPVSPLSVRSGPSGIQYPNLPRYPWSKKQSAKLSQFYDNIFHLYKNGFKLVALGHIEPGTDWYKCTRKVESADVSCFLNRCKILSDSLDTIDANSKTLITSLPNYTKPQVLDLLQQIDNNTMDIKPKVITIDTNTSVINPKLDRLQQSVDKIDLPVDKLNQIDKNVSQIKSTNEEIYKNTFSGSVLQKRIKTIDEETQFVAKEVNGANAKLDQIKIREDEIFKHAASALKVGHCYEYDIQKDSPKLCHWLLKSETPCPFYSEEDGTCQLNVEQGAESFTTTREDEGMPVVITDTNKKSTVAPTTVSENAMNLQTLLRRYFPVFVSSDLEHTNDFTVITVPVTPSFTPSDTATTIVDNVNRHYDAHNLAWFSRLYTYFRGSLRFKILVNADNSDIYVWHNPVDTKTFHVSSGFLHDHLTDQMNFATDVAITRVQQGVEVEIPFYSGFNQLLHSHISEKPDLRAQNGTLYIAVRNKFQDFNVSIFMSTGDDFFLNVLRSPPVIHEPASYAYDDDTTIVKFPELQKALHHTSSTCQIPGTYVFDRYKDGNFINSYSKDFRFKQLAANKPQIVEQMFSMKDTVTNAAHKLAGIDEIKNNYYSDVKPILDKANVGIDEFRDFLDEIKNQTIPSLLGQGKYFCKDVNTALDMLHTVLPRLTDLADNLNVLTINANNFMDVNIDTAKEVNEISHYMCWFYKSILYASLWLNLCELFNKFSFTTLLNVILTSCVLFHVEIGTVYSWLLKEIFENCRLNVPDGGLREQGLEEFLSENSDMVSIVLACVATIIYCALFGNLPTWQYIKECVKETVEGPKEQGGLSDFLRTVHFSNLGFKAISNTFEFFQKWIDKLLKYMIGKESHEVLLEKQFKEKAKQIEDWIDAITELEDEDLYHLALTDVDIHNKFYKLADQGKEFTKWLMTEGVSKNVSSIIRDTNKRLHEMIKRVNEIRPGHGFRYAPFVILMNGPSGVAKSNMMSQFSDLIIDELKIPYFNSKYSVPKTDKFLDGYEGQAIIEWDDVLQCPEQDNLIADFINWRSNADCIINKAKLEQKGMHFCSKAIIMSSNSGNISINTIRDMNAFRNRINIKFECELAPGFTSDTLKTLDYDPDFGFVRLNAFESANEGRNYRLVRANMTLNEAKDFIRVRFAAWDIKQNNLIDDYMAKHGSLRIPKGVIIKDDELEIESGLDEEEDIEAELFKIQWDEDEDFKTRCLNFIKSKCKQTKRTSNKYFHLMKRKFILEKNKFLNKITEFYGQHPTFVKSVGIITMLLSSAALFKVIYSMFTSQTNSDEAYNILTKTPKQIITAEHYSETPKVKNVNISAEHYSEVPKTKSEIKLKSEHYNEVSKRMSYKLKAEGTDDTFTIGLARSKVHNLMCIVAFEKEEQDGIRRNAMNALCIGGKILLIPFHFFRHLKDGDFFSFYRNEERIMVEFVSNRLERIRDKDACLYFMGPAFDSRKSILKHFVSENHLSRLGKSVSSVLIGTTLDNKIMEKDGIATSNVKFTYSSEDGQHSLTQYGWSYPFNTVNGECGSVLLLCSKAIPPPERIAGIHVAGCTNYRGGYACLLTKEMVSEALESINARFGVFITGASLPSQVSQDPAVFQEQVKIVPQGNFSYYGTMNAAFCPSQPQKTCLTPTPWQGQIYPVEEMPAMLKPKDGVFPLQKGIDKYGVPTIPFTQKDIKIVRNSILNDLLSCDGDLIVEVLDVETAIFGLSGVAYCDKMNMRSSPGWPYQCLPEYKDNLGKAYLFDEEKRCIKDQLLLQNLAEREEMAKRGERFPSIWRDCLKDELRPIEKVKAGKTRVFTIAPVDFTILVRQYFLSFEQAFYKNHSKFFSAVGINPESYEWTMAYNRLRAYGNKCIAGDFSQFDGSLMPELIYEVGTLIDDWYKFKGEQSQEATIVRSVLFDEIIHTYQLVQNCVYKTHQGNPSGNPLTVIVNTIVNAFYMRLAFLEIMRETNPMWATMETFNNYVIDEIYGDDNRLVVRDELIPFYNQVSIASCLAKHGIKYTDADKSDTLVPWKYLDETTFLKRGYRVDSEVGLDVKLPVLSTKTLHSLTNWYRKPKGDELNIDRIEEQIQADMRSALDFAFFYGREYYNQYYKDFCKEMRLYGLRPLSVTYDEQLDRFIYIVRGERNLNFMQFDWLNNLYCEPILVGRDY